MPSSNDLFLLQRNPNFAIGGKAANLFVLRECGFRVPDFVVIPWEMLRDATPDEIEKAGQAIAAHFNDDAPQGWAVRSSALGEDGQEHSFAGLFETFLHVKQSELGKKIAAVQQSVASARVQAYRRERGLPPEMGIAIVVQRMVQPDVAGVAFGAHPVSGRRDEKVISAVYGLGEGLVSGALDADTFTVRADGHVESQLAYKDQQMVFDTKRGSGTTLVAVPLEQQGRPTLCAPQLQEITAALDRLYAHFQHPQDIEFAVAEGQLFLLQTRPVTTLLPIKNEGQPDTIWDNSNIVESYPGLTSPLTFSFIIKMYEAVYRQFMGMMGVSAAEVADNRFVLANMLGLIEGRVFYNLLHWYKALAVLPGYALNAEFMERMMGVKERFVLDDLPQRSCFRERLRVLNLLRVMWTNWRALPEMRRSFEADFEDVMREYDSMDFSSASAEHLMHLYFRYEKTLLEKWKAPLVNDFFAMIFFGVLQKLTAKYGLDDSGTLHNNLLCGARDIVSTEPIHRCLRLAAEIQDDDEARPFFLQQNADALAQHFAQGLFPEKIQSQIAAYLQRWGNRCVGELKLETVTYRQQPSLFLAIIQSYVRQDVRENDARLDLVLREQAEQTVRNKLRGKPFKRLIFNYFLRHTRILVSARENLRYARTRGYGTVREIFCALGDRFFEARLLAAPRDIFHLTQTEIFDHIKGTSTHGNLRELVAMRQSQYHNWENAEPPAERFATRGIVYVDNDFRLNRNPQAPPSNGNTLQGVGCCPGRIRAKVRVLRRPDEIHSLDGDILVTMSTDPGWVTLFPTASAILVEKGSLLSHSAIVSREMGKPCIVGISGLLARLQTGDWVEMDGSTGMVHVVDFDE